MAGTATASKMRGLKWQARVPRNVVADETRGLRVFFHARYRAKRPIDTGLIEGISRPKKHFPLPTEGSGASLGYRGDKDE